MCVLMVPLATAFGVLLGPVPGSGLARGDGGRRGVTDVAGPLYWGAITPRAGQGDRLLGRPFAGVQVRAVRTGGEEGGPYGLFHSGNADTAAHHFGCQGDGREEAMGELHTGRHQVCVPDGLQVPEHDEVQG